MVMFLMFVFLYSNTVILKPVISAGLTIRNFSATKACNLQSRLDAKCAVLQPGLFRSIVECSARCSLNCVSVSLLKNKQCYVHLECPVGITLEPCSSDDETFNFYIKDVPCFHQGVFNESSGLCECVAGWVGLRCERTPTSCEELMLFGYKVPQTIWTYVKVESLDKPFKLICSLYQGFVTSRLMLNLGYLQPNRTWQEFVEGFYVNDNNFWIGLEKMRILNTGNSTILRIDTQFGLDSNYNLFAYTYNHFQFGNSSSGYSINFGKSGMSGAGPEFLKYNSSFTSCLGQAKNVSFSTADKDNDGIDQENCAAQNGIGWWFSSCNLKCNPLGSRDDWLAMTGINLTSASYAESMMYLTTA